MRLKKILFIAPLVLAFLAMGFILGSAQDVATASWFSENGTQAVEEETIAPPTPDQPLTTSTFRDIAKLRSDAVVNISTTTIIKRESQQNPHRFRSPFDDFFGDDLFRFFSPQRQNQKVQSLGSGVIFDKDGYILTNNHVIQDVDEIQVTTLDGKTYDAEMVGSDPQTDIGLIKITPDTDLTAVPMGDSELLEVGDWVMAIGNPFGFGHTVTVGVVSAKGRSLVMPTEELPYQDFIQTDASINPGNSGGPLLDIHGRLVGINSVIASRTGQSAGIGFAIPINLIKPLLPQLKDKGSVTRGWLGVSIQPLTKELADSLDLNSTDGALISELFSDSPADEAGLKVGDVILDFNGTTIKDSSHLSRTVAATPVGSDVTVKFIRDGKKKSVTVTLGERPSDLTQLAASPGKVQDLGMSVQEITPEFAQRYGLDSRSGVIVSDVEPGGPADKANIQRGDIILRFGQKEIKDIEDYRKAVSAMEEGSAAVLYIQRGDSKIFVAVRSADKE